jgi:glycosyltransferase involved in cell wall biosynthesis
MKIAYLVNRYPAVSHSFIRREIQALERLGHEITRISVRQSDASVLGPEDRAELVRTRSVLANGAGGLLSAFLRVLMTRPARLARAFALALKLGRRAERPLPVHVIYLLEACRVLRWLDAEKIEHLHAHFGTNSAEVAMLVHALGGPRWSFTAHGPEEFDKAAFIALPEKIRRAAFVVAISSFGRSQLLRQVSHEHWDKVRVVRCGIEGDFYANTGAPTTYSSRLVCVGRLCEQKGQLLLVEAAKQLVQAGMSFQLVLAGDGEMRPEIERLVTEYGLTSTVKITGWIPPSEVRNELLAARAMVLPSFAEGLPVVIMESMVLSRPVISTYVAGIPELVEPGQHGWLVPAGDVGSLVAAMRDCLECPDRIIGTMGDKARIRAIERHDADREAAKLSDLFQTAR